jgi:hypothetical protein
MDELEWLKEHAPPTAPSRDVTRRHRTQLRAAIATEGANGTRPRRPRRQHRSRHRVLATTAVVVALCAAGAGVIALTSSGGVDTPTVGAPAASGPDSTLAVRACVGAPPKELEIPTGFGTAVAAPAKQAVTAPTSTQQVTSWTSADAAIEERWPADSSVAAKLVTSDPPAEGFSSFADPDVIVDGKGAAHRNVVLSLPGQAQGCALLQVTVYATDAATVKVLSDELISQPFRSSQPLVTTTGVATSAPGVVACSGVAEKAAMPVVATVGGKVDGGAFAEPADALAEFLPSQKDLYQRGYDELRLDDSSVVFVKQTRDIVVTTVHVEPTSAGWTVSDWQASGC